MKRGEVWVANLNPNQDAEAEKIRPVLIIQEDALIQEGAPTIIILPISLKLRTGFEHYRVTLPVRDRLLKESQVIIEKPRALDRRRFGEGPLTALTADELAKVERGLLAVMGMAGYLPDL